MIVTLCGKCLPNMLNHVSMTVAVILLCSAIAQGSDEPIRAAEYYRYDLELHTGGLAGAVVSRIKNVSAVYYNPAGLIRVPGVQVLGTYQDVGFDTYCSFIGFAVAKKPWLDHALWKNTAVGFGWAQKQSAYLDRRRVDEVPVRSFDVDDGAFILGLASELPVFSSIDLSVGINLQILYRDLEGHDLTESTTLGLQARPQPDGLFSSKWTRPLRLGMVFQNINKPAFKSDDSGLNEIPRAAVLGIAYEGSLNILEIPIAWAIEWNLRGENGRSPVNLVGLDIVANLIDRHPLALRAGWATEDGDFSLGLGFRIPLDRFGWDIDLLPFRIDKPEFVDASSVRFSTALSYPGKKAALKKEPKEEQTDDKLPPIPGVIIPSTIGPNDSPDANEGQ